MLDAKKIWICFLAIPFLLFMSPEDPGHNAHSMDFLGKVINFVVLFGGLFLILRSPIKKYFNERRKEVNRSIEEAAENRMESENKLGKAQSKLDSLSKEVKKIKDQANSEGRKQKEKILASANQEVKRLKDLNRQEIDLIYDSGKKELRAYAGEMAIKTASKRIKQRMTPKLHSDIIDKSIERLEKLHERPDSR
jgi:F-type H+-transporting ATPase subunit b